MMDEDNQIVVSFGFWTEKPLNEHTENKVRSNIISALENKCCKRVEEITLSLSTENVWVHLDSYNMSYENLTQLMEQLDEVGIVQNPNVTTVKATRAEFTEMDMEPPV